MTVFDRPDPRIPELAQDPADTRRIFAGRGWRACRRVPDAGPIHRAHEYLTKVALETVDGLLVHPLVGETKSDDVPVDVRVECYRMLLDGYYPTERVLLSAFPAAMLRRAPRGDLARDLPEELRLLALHRRPRPRRRGRLLRHVRRAAHLRRVRAARARHRADVLRAHVLVQRLRVDGEHEVVPARPRGRSSCRGRRSRDAREGNVPPVRFTRPEVAQVLIDAYRQSWVSGPLRGTQRAPRPAAASRPRFRGVPRSGIRE